MDRRQELPPLALAAASLPALSRAANRGGGEAAGAAATGEGARDSCGAAFGHQVGESGALGEHCGQGALEEREGGKDTDRDK